MVSSTTPCPRPRCLPSIGESSSFTASSEESSIFNAIRARSLIETSRDNSLLDRTNAATVARLLPFSSAHSTCSLSTGTSTPHQGKCVIRPYRWHPYTRPKVTTRTPSTYPGRRQSKHPRRTPTPTALEISLRRHVLSLNDADTCPSRKPKWTEHLTSPAHPMRPRYSPPERAPTPPGIPSFGTPEAMLYTAQIVDGRDRPQTTTRQTSYRNSLCQFLGFSSSAPASASSTNHSNRPHILARAADGTAVLGRFPCQQSGHGVTMMRRVDDHPFHRRTLPVAPVAVSSSPPAHGENASGRGLGRRLSLLMRGETDNPSVQDGSRETSGYDGLLQYSGWQAGIFDHPRDTGTVAASSTATSPARTRIAAGKEDPRVEEETDSLVHFRDFFRASMCCWLGRRK